MMNDNLNEARIFVKTHFQKSEWKVCKLNSKQLAELVSTASNGIQITSLELEQILKEMGYRHHQSTGRYMMRLSPILLSFARDRMNLI